MAWPRDNEADLIRFYGDPESDSVAQHLVKVTPPFKMFYAGTPVPQLSFHRLAAPALERALKTVWEYYGRDQARIDALGISKTAGTYNRRKISGSDRWSNHAFGAAIDINAEQNGFNVAGNIPIPMIAAFKAEGARWGGDYKGRTDPMHFEFCESGEPVRSFEGWLAFYGAPAGAQQPTGVRMRFTGITATVFGGPSDSMSGTETAYGNLVAPGWWDRPGVSLPARINTRSLPKVTVSHNGRSVVCDVIDVGPWNIRDPYWETGTRPRAELGLVDDYGRTPTNKAGIDLTPAAARAIGLEGKGLVDWDFVSLNGEVLPPITESEMETDKIVAAVLAALEARGVIPPAPPPPVTLPPAAGPGFDINQLLPLLLQTPVGQKLIGGKAATLIELLPLVQQVMALSQGRPVPALPAPAAAAVPVETATVPAPAAATSPGWTNLMAAIAGVTGSLGLSAAGVIGPPAGDGATLVGMALPLASVFLSALGIPAPVVGILGNLLSRFRASAPAKTS